MRIVSVDMAQVSEVMLLAGAHYGFIFGTRDMVVAPKVEYAVGEEVGNLGVQGMTNGVSLALGGRQGDSDVAKELFIGHPLDEVVRFIEAKGLLGA